MSGIIELPADAPVGTAFADYAGLDDPVFDVAITPNRQDCMGVRGIARDLAAAGHRHAQAARRAADRGQLPVPGAESASRIRKAARLSTAGRFAA